MNYKKGVSIYDIAKMAHVSPSTVSKVLNQRRCVNSETADKVNHIMMRTGFKPHWKAPGNNCIGLLLPPYHGLSEDNYSLQIFAYCQEYLASKNYSIEVLCPSAVRLNKQKKCSIIAPNVISGIIVISVPDNYDVAKALLAESRNFPCATIGKFDSDIPNHPTLPNHILADDYNAGVQAATILLRHNHKTVMIVTPHLTDIVHSHRLAGAYDTFLQAGISESKISRVEIVNDLWNGGVQLAASLACAAELPESLIFTNSSICAGFVVGCQAMKMRIPDDFSVIGFEDAKELQFLATPITVLHTPSESLAKDACDTLLAQIEHTEFTAHGLIAHTLIPRQSVRRRN